MLQLQQEKIHPQRLFRFFLSFFLIFLLITLGAWVVNYFTPTSYEFALYYQPLFYSIIIGISGYNLYRFLILGYEAYISKTLFNRVNLQIGRTDRISPPVIKAVVKATIIAGIIFNAVLVLAFSLDWYFFSYRLVNSLL